MSSFNLLPDNPNYAKVNKVQFDKEGTSTGQEAFNGSRGLKEVILPQSQTRIGMSAFEGCVAFESVDLSGVLQSIESWVFSCCPNLVSFSITEFQ